MQTAHTAAMNSEDGYVSDGDYDANDSTDADSGYGCHGSFDGIMNSIASNTDTETEMYKLEEQLNARLAEWGKSSLSDAMSAYSKLNIRLVRLNPSAGMRELLDASGDDGDGELPRAAAAACKSARAVYPSGYRGWYL